MSDVKKNILPYNVPLEHKKADVKIEEEVRIDIPDKEHWCGNNQRSCVVYISQLVICSVVICASIINISLNPNAKNDTWLVLLSSCLGYLLPSPTMQSKDK